MSAAPSQVDYTQLMYIAYYGRPGDPVGLGYWSDRLAVEGAEEVVDFFGNSDEFRDNYGSLTTEQLINGLYRQLFGRDADPGGLAFWSGQLDSGVATLPDIALRIINGVQPGSGDDLVVANRLLVANYVTNLRGGSPLRDTILDGVSADPATVDAALAQLGITIEERERYDLSIEENDSKFTFRAAGDEAPVGVASTAGADPAGLAALRADPRFADLDGSGYTVVVIDTGIDLDHPAFGDDTDGDGVADRILIARDFSNDGDASADDVAGHGTHVASVVGSQAADYPGVAPGANIIALQVLDNNGDGTAESLQRALQWVIDNRGAFNIVAVNLSLGTGQNSATPLSDFAADEFAALADLGVINVAAAGNSYFDYQSEGVDYPAADPQVIAVGATFEENEGAFGWTDGARADSSGTDRVLPVSQRSDLLTPVFAPGALITGAGPGGGSYGTTGTSQAAAYVSGLAALAQQLADQLIGRQLTPGEFLSLLSSSGDAIVDGDDEDDNVANTGDTYTRVNALALAEAIEAFAEGAPPLPEDDDIPGDPSTTATLAIGSFTEGELETRGDTDWFRVELQAGVVYRFAMAGLSLEDPWLAVHGPDGAFLVANNDANGTLDAALNFTAPTDGSYYLSAEAFAVSQTGSYIIDAQLAGVDFGDDIPANSATQAALPLGGSFSSQIDFAGDEDWLRISLEAGSTYRLTVAGSEGAAAPLEDPVLEIYAADGTLLAVNDDGGPGLTPLLNFSPPGSGTYFASVRAYGALDTGAYTATLEDSADAANDTIPGNTTTDATLAVGGSASSAIDFIGDRDWFAVTLSAGERYVFGLEGSGDSALGDPFLQLFSAIGVQLASDDDSGSGRAARLAYVPESSGTFYISAEGAAATVGAYTLSLGAGEDGTPDSVNGLVIGDAGDSIPAAAFVALDDNADAGAAGSTGFLNDSADFYRFTAPADGFATFSLGGLVADLDLALLDGSGATVASSALRGSSAEQLFVSLTGGVGYTLQVQPFGSAASDYSLSLDLSASGETGPQETVDGVGIGDAADSNDAAAPIPDSGAVLVSGSTGFGNDTGDRFIFTADGDGTAIFTLSGLAANLDLAVLNSSGTVLASAASAGSGVENLELSLGEGESYIVWVYPVDGPSSYVLDLQLPAGGEDDVVNGTGIGDAGDSAAAATTISLDDGNDAVITGSAGFRDDSGDVYRFTAPANGFASVSLFGLGADLDLQLLDDNGVLLASDPAPGASGESISANLVAGEDYLLSVQPVGAVRSAYSLTLDADQRTGIEDIVNGTVIGDAGPASSPYGAETDAAGAIAISGSTGFGDDAGDAFRFTAPGTGPVVLTIAGIDPSATLGLNLVDEAGRGADVSGTASAAGLQLESSLLAGELYTVEVAALSGASDYTLAIAGTVNTGDPDIVGGTTIGDAGDSAATGYPTPLDRLGDVAITGSTGFDSDAADHYSISIPGDGIVQVDLSGLADDLDLELLNAAGTVVAASSRSGSSAESLDFAVLAGESYTVRVEPFRDRESNYSLNIDAPEEVGRNEVVNGTDIGDAGNSVAASFDAAADRAGDVLVEGSAGSGSDSADHFSVTVPGDGDVVIGLDGLGENLDLLLLDAEGVQLDASSSAGTAAETLILEGAAAGATYIVVVRPEAEARSDYGLSIDMPEPAGRNDTVQGVDIGDAGGSAADAFPAAPDRNADIDVLGATGFLDDGADYFRFLSPGSGDLLIDLTGLSEDLDLQLLDADGVVLASASTGGAAAEAIDFGAAVAGASYTVLVQPVEGARSEYALRIDAPEEAGRNDIVDGGDIGDAGDNAAVPYRALTDEFGDIDVEGSTGFADDAGDYFRFVARDSGSLLLTLTGLDEDLDLRLLDGARNELAVSSSAGTATEGLEFDLEAGAAYIVAVDPAGDARSDYTLSIDGPAEPVVIVGDIVNGVDIGDAGNSVAAASPVTPDEELLIRVDGVVGDGDDSADNFLFTAPFSGTLRVDLTGLADNLDLLLSDSAGATLASSRRGGSSDEGFSFAVREGLSYVVQVDPFGPSSSDYLLDIALPAQATGGNDVVNGLDIGDAGNSFADSYLTALDSDGLLTVDGSNGFVDDTADYFSFTATAAGDLNLTLSGLDDNLDLELLDADGALLVRSSVGGSASESISRVVQPGQTFTAVVLANGIAESDYLLSVVQLEEEPTGADDIVDGSNIGDASDSVSLPYDAGEIDRGTIAITGSTGFETDGADVYRFTTTQSGNIFIDLFNLDENLDLRISYVDDEGNFVERVLDSPGIDTESITLEAYDFGFFSDIEPGLGIGIYTVEVLPAGDARSNYNLDIDVRDFQPVDDIVNGVNFGDLEDGEGGPEVFVDSSGDLLVDGGVGFPRPSGPDDAGDSLVFQVPDSGPVSISLTGLSDDLDLSVSYFEPSDEDFVFLSSDNSGIAAETLDFSVSDGVFVFVDVIAPAGGRSEYLLSIDGPAPFVGQPDRVNGVTVPGGDAGTISDPAAAPFVTVDEVDRVSAIAGSVSSVTDPEDAYRFTTEGFVGGFYRYDISLAGATSDTDLFMILYDSSGDVVDSGAGFIGLSDFAIGEEYTVEVFVTSGPGTDYDLEILGVALSTIP